jgi:hypothetical protein
MGLFTSSTPARLDPGVEAAISSAFCEDVIGPKLHRKMMAKIGAEQVGLLGVQGGHRPRCPARAPQALLVVREVLLTPPDMIV